MGGNVNQWTSDFDENGNAIALGGSWNSQYSWHNVNDLENKSPGQSRDPSQGYNDIGFRLAGSPSLVSPPIPLDYQKTDLLSELGSTAVSFTENVLLSSIELIIYEELGIWFVIPYVTLMGTCIAYELSQQEYTLAKLTTIHMLFDVAAMIGIYCYGIDIEVVLGGLLDACGLSSVKNFMFGTKAQILCAAKRVKNKIKPDALPQ